MADVMVAKSAFMPQEALQVSNCFPNPLPLPGEKNCLGLARASKGDDRHGEELPQMSPV